MLKGIDPLLSPALLRVLAEMGHGDEIVIADANFTAATLGRGKPVLQLPGAGVARTCAAVLSVLPLDEAVDRPVAYMHVSGQPEGFRSAVQREVVALLTSRGWAAETQCEATERFAFYERVRGAFAIVQTGELQPFANVLLKKGVIAEPLAP
jgi:L-fucose mutarotase